MKLLTVTCKIFARRMAKEAALKSWSTHRNPLTTVRLAAQYEALQLQNRMSISRRKKSETAKPYKDFLSYKFPDSESGILPMYSSSNNTTPQTMAFNPSMWEHRPKRESKK